MKTMSKVQPAEKDQEALLKSKMVSEKIKEKTVSSLSAHKKINPRLLIL